MTIMGIAVTRQAHKIKKESITNQIGFPLPGPKTLITSHREKMQIGSHFPTDVHSRFLYFLLIFLRQDLNST